MNEEFPVREGYKFAGWYTDDTCLEGSKWDFRSPVTDVMVLHAKWVKDDLKVEFKLGIPDEEAQRLDIKGIPSQHVKYRAQATAPSASVYDSLNEDD
jgi:uncharacterized repeat protein (TIGR02543 family)